MTAELVRGQNHPLSRTRLELRVSADRPVVAGATLSDARGTTRGPEWVAHPGAPTLPGLEVSRQAAAVHRLAVDLDAMPEDVHRVSVLLALPTGLPGPVRFGGLPAPFVAVTGLDGTEIAGYTLTGLDAESAVIAVELYRRQGAWKVRAVGQGYADGLAALLADQGLAEAHSLAAAIHDAVAQGAARSVAPAPHPADGDHARQTTVQALGADQGPAGPQIPLTAPLPGEPTGDPTAPGGGASAAQSPAVRPESAPPPPTAPFDGDLSGAPTRPGATPSVAPDASGQPPAGTPAAPTASPSASSGGGRVDYRHPRRQTAAPPPPPPAAPPSEPGQPPRPVAGDATGWSMDERLYNQVWGMFEDLARTTAAYRSAVDFADSRLGKELDRILADPRHRIGGQGAQAREEARARHAELVGQARAALDRDLAQLTAESEVVEPALPPAFARWDSPVWQAYKPPTERPMALRLGDLRLPEAPGLAIPMLVRLPLERGLWIDSGRTAGADGSFTDAHETKRLAMDTAVAVAGRLLAVHPPGAYAVHVIDPAGSGRQALDPLARTGSLSAPPAATAAGIAQVLRWLTQRVDLVQMAVRGGAPDALPPDVDLGEQILVVNDFPHGFDDRAVTQLRYLADEGPAVGVHLMLVADREESAAYGPLLDPLWRSLLRLTPVPDSHLADPWVGHAWTYEPSLVPAGSRVLHEALEKAARLRDVRR